MRLIGILVIRLMGSSNVIFFFLYLFYWFLYFVYLVYSFFSLGCISYPFKCIPYYVPREPRFTLYLQGSYFVYRTFLFICKTFFLRIRFLSSQNGLSLFCSSYLYFCTKSPFFPVGEICLFVAKDTLNTMLILTRRTLLRFV